MSAIALDLRQGLRRLAHHPGVTVLAVATLALAIGATTAIFSVVYGVLLQPLPYPASGRLMAVAEINHRGTLSRLADPNFDDFRDRNRTFSSLAKYTSYTVSVSGGTEPTRSVVGAVSRDFFKTMGVGPSIGRPFGGDDTHVGAAPVAIVSHAYWSRYLGGATDLSSAHVRIEDRVYAVVGVMPAGFSFPVNADVWLPSELDAENQSRTSHNFSGIGRLRDGVSVADAAADLSAIARDIVRRATSEHGDYLLADATTLPLQDFITGRTGSTLYILLGAVFFLLLVACANVTNLLLSQAAARRRELAVRQALGAGRARLVRQFIAESLVLLAMSAGAGLLVASLGVKALLALAPPDLPRTGDVAMSWPVLTFAIGLAAMVAVGLGIVTALRATIGDQRQSLGEGRGQAGSASSMRAGRLIIAGQVAITVVLLVGAALLGRSLMRVLSVDPGYRTTNLLAIDVALPSASGADAKGRLATFYGDLFDRLHAIPGVEDVAAASNVPMSGGLPDGMFAVIAPEEMPKSMDDMGAWFQRKDRIGTADFCVASPAYFHALGIPLVRGRLFDEHDQFTQPHVAVISESLARARWPKANPIGRTIEFGNMDGDLRLLTIVGIVGDTREYGLEQPPQPTVYVDLLQRPRSFVTVILRSSGDPAALTSGARDVLHAVAPDVPPRFRTFEQIYSASLGARHFNLTLVTVFAVTALLLAVAGIYGVMAYTVTRRRREIGVRLALGARPGQIVRIIFDQGMTTTVAGVAVGIVAALALTRTMQSLLFGVTPTDPAAFAAVVLVLCAVAAIACYLPARRATLVDPAETLRQE
jgi:putative ABC transport system permease protein